MIHGCVPPIWASEQLVTDLLHVGDKYEYFLFTSQSEIVLFYSFDRALICIGYASDSCKSRISLLFSQ
jgi:hypothetical protein